MYLLRRWSVRQAGPLEVVYNALERVLVALHPLWKRIGYERIERPMAFAEKTLKGLLFDCQMCGQCALGSSGMSCPMNCPKNLRNGPCGGVRDNGHCEVHAWMRCVWVEAYEGSRRMKQGSVDIRNLQKPVDRRLQGRSAWMIIAREKGEAAEARGEAA